ncbi:helix-turn-helix domain-containing protein [Thermogemmatispora sp.]|uniref:helix-turn-helix domain-containing protein n=1 Tax=Thermogemmatispora sp. TaxID=1968838 RepID=UPI003A10332B
MLRLRVKEVAEKRGLSPRALAQASGLSDKTIARLYRNPCHDVTTLTLSKLAMALGVPSRELLEELPDAMADLPVS